MAGIDKAAESMAERIRTLPPDDPLLKHLEASSAEFLRSRGFDTSTRAGCTAAVEWLRSCRVEEAFWDEDSRIGTAADWYIGEARIDGLIKVLENRIRQYFPSRNQ